MAKAVIEIIGQSQGLDDVNIQLDAAKQKEKDLLKEMKALTMEMDKYAGNKKMVQQFNAEYEKTKKTLGETRKSIEDLSEAQKSMKGQMLLENTTLSAAQLKNQIISLIDSWTDFSETGKATYDALIEKAAELTDAMGDHRREIEALASDSYAFDTIVEGVQLSAGGFAVAEGAMALFGAESERVKEMMVKLQAAIALSTGVQQIANAVQKESNIIREIGNLKTKAAATAESIKAAATGKGVIATKLATAAQAVFNFIASQNPYLLLFTGLAAVVGALLYFTRETKSASEAQIELNAQETVSLDIQDRMNKKAKERADEAIKEKENDLALAKARGAGIEEIRALEDKLAMQRRINHEIDKNNNQEDAADLEDNQKKLRELEKQLDKVNEAKANGDKKIKVDVDLDGKPTKEKVDDAITALQGAIDNTNRKIQIAVELKEQGDDINQKDAEDAARRQKEDEDRTKRSAQALADYRVLMAEKGSEQELKAQKAALRVKLKNDLSNVDLTEGERIKLRGEAQKAIEKLDEDYHKKQLQDAVTTLDAELAEEREFDLQTFNLRAARLEAQKQLDLANAKDDKAKQLLIEEQYKANLIKLDDEFAKSEAQREANINQSNLNARLAATKAGSQEEKAVKIELLEENARAEIENAKISIKNEEERAAKIAEIQAKLNSDKSDLDKEYIKSADERSKAEVLAVTQQYGQGKMSKQEYENQLKDIGIKSLEDEIAERRAKGEETIELEKELSERRISIAEEEKAARQQIYQELFGLMGNIGNAFFDAENQRLSQEMEDLNHYYTTDAEAAKKNKDLKLISEDEMARRQLEIRRKQAQAEKNQAYFNATMQLAEGIVRIWSQTGVNPILAGILTGILVANAAVQIASIQNKPLPKYWKGRKGGKGEWALTGEYGPELMWLPDGASVMPNRDTRRALAGEVDLFDRWNMPRLNPNIPAMPVSQKIINQYNQEHRNEDRIDYDKLGRAVAKHMKFPKQKDVSVHFDKSGLRITEGNTTTQVKNSKYSANV
jgi:hypothetical protein